MKKQLFPKEFISSSLEHYTFRIQRKSNAIYLILLLFFGATIAVLPFVGVNVTVLSSGIVDTKERSFELFSPVSGLVEVYQFEENQFVHTGDTLVSFDASLVHRELDQINEDLENVNKFMSDLELLMNVKSGSDKSQLASSRYQLNYLQFTSALNKLQIESDKLKRIFDRQQSLFHQRVVAAAEFESDQSNYERAKAEIEFFEKQSLNIWRESFISHNEEKDRLILKRDQLTSELKRYVLLAPSRGELQQVVVLRKGQFVQSGMKLGELSPDTTLIATCWIPPKDIGLLHKGMMGSFRIDAFPSNQWGFLNGKIRDISSDVYIINNQPLFKVKCDLEQNFLMLKNDFVGKLKKGMTFQANFRLTKRTLYQLLHDKVDDWLNPNRK